LISPPDSIVSHTEARRRPREPTREAARSVFNAKDIPMALHRWLRSIRRILGLGGHVKRQPLSRRWARLQLESLEDRVRPTFSYTTPFPWPTVNAGFDPQGIVAADFNMDGKIDVALGSGMQVQPGNVLVPTGQGNGTFVPAGNQIAVGDST